MLTSSDKVDDPIFFIYQVNCFDLVPESLERFANLILIEGTKVGNFYIEFLILKLEQVVLSVSVYY